MKTSNSQCSGPQRMARVSTVWLLGLALVVVPLLAQGVGGRRGLKKEAFERLLFAPELVMSHQREIGLSQDQKKSLVQEIQNTQTDLVPLMLEISEAGEGLMRLLEQRRVDEEQALAEAERVMHLETEIKKRHLLLAIRIKNLLSPEQQEELRRIRDGRGS